MPFWKRESRLLKLRNAFRAAGFHTDSASRFSGMGDKILVWKNVPERGAIAVGYIDDVQLGSACFCFPSLQREDPVVREAIDIAESLRKEGISTTPVDAFTIAPLGGIRQKDEATAG